MNWRFILIALVCLSLISTAPVAADSGINILHNEVDISFPGSIVFNIEAQSDSNIVDARLQYQVLKRNHATVVSESWADVVPSEHIYTSWLWDMRKSSLPPGTSISYWWILVNEDGDSHKTAVQELSFVDTRYDWKRLEDDNLILYWYEGDDQFAQELMDVSLQGIAKLGKDTGTYPDELVSIYLYASSNDLRGAMVFPQEWTGGAAFTEFNTIAIGISPENIDWGKEALVHELTHLVIHQSVYSPYGRLPTWLDEGLAMYNEGNLSYSFQSSLDDAIKNDALISVRSLCSDFSADPGKAYLAYAESYSIVEYLLVNFGREEMLKLLTVIKEGSTYDNALLQVYGFDVEGLDERWQETFKQELIEQEATIWHPALIAVLAALGTVVTLAFFLLLEDRHWRKFNA